MIFPALSFLQPSVFNRLKRPCSSWSDTASRQFIIQCFSSIFRKLAKFKHCQGLDNTLYFFFDFQGLSRTLEAWYRKETTYWLFTGNVTLDLGWYVKIKSKSMKLKHYFPNCPFEVGTEFALYTDRKPLWTIHWPVSY